MLIQFDPEILLQGMYAINELTKAYQNHNTQTHAHTHTDLSVATLVIAEKKKREKLEMVKELINTRVFIVYLYDYVYL